MKGYVTNNGYMGYVDGKYILFASDKEEMQTTVTIYISQETDTIESIAKRFEIPTLRLIKDNDLAGDKISTGQLLYIPRT